MLLAFAHFVIDVHSNTLAPLLPLFIPQMHCRWRRLCWPCRCRQVTRLPWLLPSDRI
jgi:hypothetical protein